MANLPEGLGDGQCPTFGRFSLRPMMTVDSNALSLIVFVLILVFCCVPHAVHQGDTARNGAMTKKISGRRKNYQATVRSNDSATSFALQRHTKTKSRGFTRAAGFYLMDRCMYPISLILDSLRNDVRRFHTTIEARTQDTLELVRIGDPVSIAGAKMAKYIKATLAVLGLGLLSVAAFLGLVSTDAVTSMESPLQTPSCRYMTVSLARGKLVPGAPGVQPAANVPCTTTMLQTSQLCREQCASWAP